jgi:hypothetical protein
VKAADLSPPQRRLLRTAGSIEPNELRCVPGEAKAASELADLGLVEQRMFGGVALIAITEKGRKALK